MDFVRYNSEKKKIKFFFPNHVIRGPRGMIVLVICDLGHDCTKFTLHFHTSFSYNHNIYSVLTLTFCHCASTVDLV